MFRNGTTIYSIYMSRVIRLGADISFTLAMDDAPHNIRVSWQFSAGKNDTLFEGSTVGQNGKG